MQVRGREVKLVVGTPRAQGGPLTLHFSPTCSPIYVLGCAVSSSSMGLLASRARDKILAIELCRLLSNDLYTWSQIEVEALESKTDQVVLKV